MQVTFEKTGEARALITVDICQADYEAKVTEKLKEIGKKHTIPGFPELRKRFGRDVKSEAINDTVIDATMNYLQENNIRFVGQPLPAEDRKEIDIKESDYSFKYDIALWPEINIVMDKSVSLPFYKIEVTDEMIAEQDNMMRDRFGTQGNGEEVDSKAVIKGSIMELNADGTIKEGEDAIQSISSIVGPFMFKNKEEGDKFLGKKVDEKVVFNPYKACEGNMAQLASMLNVEKEVAENAQADFEFTITEIMVLKPAELGQEFYYEAFGSDIALNEEEDKEALKSIIAMQLAPNSFQLSNNHINKYLLDTYGDKVILDEELLKRWLLFVDKNRDAAKLDEEFESMLPSFKWEVISEEIVEKLDVKVTEEDLQARAKMYARQQMQQYGMYNMDEDTVEDMAKRMLADKQIRRNILNELEDLMLFDAIRKNVTMDEKTVSLDDFKKLAYPEAAE